MIIGNLSLLSLSESDVLYLPPGKRLVIQEQQQHQQGASMILLPTVANANAFAILSDDKIGDGGRFELFLCSKRFSDLVCRAINSIAIPIPASTEADIHPFSGNTFSFASIEFEEMGNNDYLGIMDKDTTDKRFLVAEPFDTRMNRQVIHQSMLCKYLNLYTIFFC